jgi:5-methylcytosine-specific restriction enzyme subunit McrC
MINLFEYQNKIEFPGEIEELEMFLDNIWQKRDKNSYYTDTETDKAEVQRFLQVLHKTKEIRSSKYVGVIRFDGQQINLLPKIFFNSEKKYSVRDISAIYNHILWWLSYCRKVKFPKYQSSLGSIKSDFFEILIYMFAKYTRELLANSIYQQYEEVGNELSYIKGRVDTARYIDENISRGRWHKINCVYDSFEMDNKFNRIVKYVSNILFNVTGSSENRKYLREILFILDEVSDTRVTAEECLNIPFNPMFTEFETVRDYCYLFLSNSISVDYKNDLKLFAFLLPMEYVFEDFIFGFIDKEIEEVKAISQSSSKYLDVTENFSLKPDLILETETKSIIADAKYKIIYSDDIDPKNGIMQNDLYQMLAYAVRYSINEIILFYPDTINFDNLNEGEIIIKDELAGGKEIRIRVYQLPVIARDIFEAEFNPDQELCVMFDGAKIRLVERVKEILLN